MNSTGAQGPGALSSSYLCLESNNKAEPRGVSTFTEKHMSPGQRCDSFGDGKPGSHYPATAVFAGKDVLSGCLMLLRQVSVTLSFTFFQVLHTNVLGCHRETTLKGLNP